MKTYHKALVVAALAVSMTAGVTGCGKGAVDGSQTVATVGDMEMKLGEANFLLRYQQVQTESYYESMLGEGIYSMDLYGNGTTFGDSFKADVMEQMQQYYILEAKAADYGVELTEEEKTAITEAAAAFLEANEENTKEQMTADQETVERVLSLITIADKVQAAVYEEADITVTDEEAAQRGFSYVKVSKGSGDSALTEDELADKKSELEALKAGMGDGKSIDAALTASSIVDLSVSTGTYGEKNQSAYEEELIKALNALSEGEATDVIETDSALYIAQLTTELDEEATETQKQSLISSQQAEYFNGLLDTWKAEYALTIDEDVWADVVFDRSYDLKSTTEE